MSTRDEHVLRAETAQASANSERPREPLASIKTPPFVVSLQAVMTSILTSHGARVDHLADHTVITFPEGTYKTEILPRLHNESYCIIFPDGFEVYEMKRRGDAYSYVQFESRQLSEEQRDALMHVHDARTPPPL